MEGRYLVGEERGKGSNYFSLSYFEIASVLDKQEISCYFAWTPKHEANAVERVFS